MAMFSNGPPKPSGYTLIANAIKEKKQLLNDRQADLEKAEGHVKELRETCARLESHVSELEHCQRALDRGYLALMGDSSTT